MIRLLVRLALVFYIALASALASTDSVNLPRYKLGDPIPVSCLNRTSEGEHVVDATGQLQYIPFPTCNETGRPLELYFGVEKDINCTIDFVSDPFFHLLEYYVHNDSPFTCRVPSRPLLSPSTLSQRSAPALRKQPAGNNEAPPPTSPDSPAEEEGQGSLSSAAYIPLIIALTGTLQLSHLHVSTHLNMLLHAAPRRTEPGVVAAGTAYSIATQGQPPSRIIIGDPLPLRFSVRWYPSTSLPSGWTGVGGHIYASTLVYCLLSAGAAVAVCFAYFRGVELPRRLRGHGRERVGGEGQGRLGGYGYGVGTVAGLGGYGVSTGGKRD